MLGSLTAIVQWKWKSFIEWGIVMAVSEDWGTKIQSQVQKVLIEQIFKITETKLNEKWQKVHTFYAQIL
jgi:hypothetical protein